MNFYYLSTDNQTVGPISYDELKVMVIEGELGDENLACKEGDADWKKVTDLLTLYRSTGASAQPNEIPPTPKLSKTRAHAEVTQSRYSGQTVIDDYMNVEWWKFLLLSTASLGLFNLLVLIRNSAKVEKITGQRSLDPFVLSIFSVLSLGVVSAVYMIVLQNRIDQYNSQRVHREMNPVSMTLYTVAVIGAAMDLFLVVSIIPLPFSAFVKANGHWLLTQQIKDLSKVAS